MSPLDEQGPTTGVTAHLGVVVVNYRSSERTARLVASLAEHGHGQPMTVVLVDNSTSSDEIRRLRAVAACTGNSPGLAVEVVTTAQNLGYAGGANVGVARVLARGADVVVVANPDCRIVAGDLRALVAAVLAAGNSLVGVGLSGDTSATGPIRVVNRWLGRTNPAPTKALGIVRDGGPPHYVSGHFLAMSRSTWLRLDGMSEDFFLFWEETDMAFRNAPHGIAVSTSVTVEHEGGGSMGAGERPEGTSPVVLFHATRGCVVYFRRHRRLRPYLPSVVVARVAWSAVVAAREGRAAGALVLCGLWAGLTHELGTPSYAQGRNS